MLQSHGVWAATQALGRSGFQPAVCALRSTGDLQDADQARVGIDEVDDPEVADTQAPEVGACQLQCAQWTRIDRQGEDRAAKLCSDAGWKATKLTLGGWRKLDSAIAFAHASSGP